MMLSEDILYYAKVLQALSQFQCSGQQGKYYDNSHFIGEETEVQGEVTCPSQTLSDRGRP